MSASGEVLGWRESLLLLGSARLPLARSLLVEDAAGARRAAAELGLPIALKAVGLVHKSERGGVVLGLSTLAEVGEAATAMAEALGPEGLPLLVQEQVDGLEILLGARREPGLGAVVVVGAGGTAAELEADTAEALVPFDEDEAGELLARLRCYPLLTGYRGRPGGDIEALCGLAAAISRLVAANHGIVELDLNPVMVRRAGEGIVVVDVRVVIAERPAPVPRPVHSLDAMLAPRHIAVVGVSEDPTKIGSRLYHYLRSHGYTGRLDIVHPAGGELDGVRRYRRLQELDSAPDLVCIAVPAPAAVAVARDAAAVGAGALLVHSSGFAETGPEGAVLQDELVATLEGAGIPFGGPNTMGIMSPAAGIVTSISGMLVLPGLPAGGIGFITSSGALGSSIASRFVERGLGMSHWIHLGNEAGVDAAQYLEWLARDPETTVVGLLLENITDGPHLVRAGRMLVEAGKPAFAFSTTRSASGRLAALSHTGALIGGHRLREAVLRRAGIVSVPTLQVLEDALGWAASSGLPGGRRLGAVTASGGACTIIADEAEASGIALPPLPEDTAAAVREVVADFAAVRNPLDVTAQIIADPLAFGLALEAILAAEAYDCVLVQLTTNADPGAIKIAEAVIELRAKASIPLYVSRYGAGRLAPRALARYAEAGIPVLDAPDRAMHAISALMAASEVILGAKRTEEKRGTRP